jgi:hypothetical protein
LIQLRPIEADLKRLKRPLGELLPGPPDKTIPRLRELVQKTGPPFMISVGDVVSRETIAAGIPVNLRIVDHRSMREALAPQEYRAPITYRARNPAGTISIESWDTIRTAVKQNQSVILVDGEEDLLALPCIVESRDKSLVLYGQPSEGMVVVRVSARIREEVDRILQRSSKEEV